MAALIVDGVTVHSLLSIFPGESPFARLSPETVNRLYQQLYHMRVLIIDEVSLINSLMLAQIDHRLKETSGNHLPFGGMPVLLFGDLLQLTPIPIPKYHPTIIR